MINVGLVVSGVAVVATSALVAWASDLWSALFLLCIASVLITGWKSKDHDLQSLSLVMWLLWVLGNEVWLLVETEQLSMRSIFLYNLIAHGCIGLISKRDGYVIIAWLSGAMCATSIAGIITNTVEPWFIVGNTLFVVRCVWFIKMSLSKVRQPESIATQNRGNVVNFEAYNGERARPTLTRTR